MKNNNNAFTQLPPIVVEVTPGQVRFPNMEIYKQQALEIQKIYENIVYPEDFNEQLKQMKSDRAYLNKKKDEINQEKIRVKKIYLKEMESFEEDCKGLIAILEKPILQIDNGIKELEKERKKRRHKEILEFYTSVCTEIEEDFREEFFQKIYVSSWENATATKKVYKEGIQGQITNYLKGLETIREMNGEEFEADAIKFFKNSLEVNEAVSYISRMKAQKAELLRKEQERLEREAREKAQRELEAEKKRLEAEKRREQERFEREAKEKAQRELEVEKQRLAEEKRKEQERFELETKSSRKVNIPFVFNSAVEQPHGKVSEKISFPTQSDKRNQPTLYVRLDGGIISGIYSTIDMDIVMLDTATANLQEELNFDEAIKNMKHIF